MGTENIAKEITIYSFVCSIVFLAFSYCTYVLKKTNFELVIRMSYLYD